MKNFHSSPANIICNQREVYQSPACIYKADSICTYRHPKTTRIDRIEQIDHRVPCSASSFFVRNPSFCVRNPSFFNRKSTENHDLCTETYDPTICGKLSSVSPSRHSRRIYPCKYPRRPRRETCFYTSNRQLFSKQFIIFNTQVHRTTNTPTPIVKKRTM